MNNSINFNSLLIICSMAFLIPLIINEVRLIKVPEVIAEILAGIIIGRSGLDLIASNPIIDFLSLFGFAYLMFLSGLEVDFSYFKKNAGSRKSSFNPFNLALSIFVLSVLLSYICANILFHAGIAIDPLLLTLIFSTTSLGIIVPTLKERKILNKAIGQTILLTALVADFTTMLMVPFVMFIVTGNKDTNFMYALMIPAVFALIYYFWKSFIRVDFSSSSVFESSQLEVRAAFALILVFVTVSEMVNIEIILGAFLAGILFSLLFGDSRNQILVKLDAIGYGFLTPIFFITLGARFDLTSASSPRALLFLPLFLIAAFTVKLIPSVILKKHFTWRQTIGAGLLLSSNLSLVIAVSFIAWKSGIITESLYSTFILMAISTCLLSPTLFFKVYQ